MCWPQSNAAPGRAKPEVPAVLGGAGAGATWAHGRSWDGLGDATSRGSTSPRGHGLRLGTAPSRCQQHRAGGCGGAMPACLGGQGANPLRNAPAGGEGTPPGCRQRWVSGQLPRWSSDRDRWRQGWPRPRVGVLAMPGSPALATGTAVPPAGGVGQILPRAVPRAPCPAAQGGRRHPPSPSTAPRTSGAAGGIPICSEVSACP